MEWAIEWVDGMKILDNITNTVLKLKRRFYNVYLHDQIGETVFT